MTIFTTFTWMMTAIVDKMLLAVATFETMFYVLITTFIPHLFSSFLKYT